MFYRKHARLQSVPVGESRTKQSEAEACNINVIMAKYSKTGLITHLNRYEGKYGDFTAITDYQTSLNIVMEAEKMFMSLPSDVRAKFENDPGKFLAFSNDPANFEKLREMGLAKPKEAEPAPQKVEIVNPASNEPPSGGGA